MIPMNRDNRLYKRVTFWLPGEQAVIAHPITINSTTKMKLVNYSVIIYIL
jgi:hypothetical protein